MLATQASIVNQLLNRYKPSRYPSNIAITPQVHHQTQNDQTTAKQNLSGNNLSIERLPKY
jgi:hypothetical protein